nr:PREDICTED: uncharacterized protein LOC109627315 [Paralichthys olivaceus]
MLRKDRRNPGPPTGNWQSGGRCQWAAMVRQYTDSGGRGYRGCQGTKQGFNDQPWEKAVPKVAPLAVPRAPIRQRVARSGELRTLKDDKGQLEKWRTLHFEQTRWTEVNKMNSWPGIKDRPQPATLANTKGRWALAWGQVLHMATEMGTSHADGACGALIASAPHSCIQESADLRQTRPAACAAGSEPAEFQYEAILKYGPVTRLLELRDHSAS